MLASTQGRSSNPNLQVAKERLLHGRVEVQRVGRHKPAWQRAAHGAHVRRHEGW
jgi:hypothetical protein